MYAGMVEGYFVGYVSVFLCPVAVSETSKKNAERPGEFPGLVSFTRKEAEIFGL